MKQIIILALASLTMLTCGNSYEEADIMITTDFEFKSGNKTLSGVKDQPANGDARAFIVLVLGSSVPGIKFVILKTRLFFVRSKKLNRV